MSCCLKVKEDRYGGVELEVVAGDAIAGFARELQAGIEAWLAADKKGLWLKVPTAAASVVGEARARLLRERNPKLSDMKSVGV